MTKKIGELTLNEIKNFKCGKCSECPFNVSWDSYHIENLLCDLVSRNDKGLYDKEIELESEEK